MANKIRLQIIDGQETYWGYDIVPIRCTGFDDQTQNELFGYDSHCSACYLGHAHSGDYHRRELAEHPVDNKFCS